jgi:hypothetical protein
MVGNVQKLCNAEEQVSFSCCTLYGGIIEMRCFGLYIMNINRGVKTMLLILCPELHRKTVQLPLF